LKEALTRETVQRRRF